ncbi:Transcriptional regulatory protein WalR-like protein [Aduncisulcus paluster]|uniref:Transcriptional regulatory protein WalR-like protein n=1 Tax=Aduncisulcus paluster TaxID=2918883 RepID=A0ABQ5KK84_9EUKA|nr:Transcriptional regulatory protein WalR-like protein [Aduncisulcus paluster]
MNLDTHEAYRGDTPLQLTPTEWKLLEELVTSSPRVVSREQLEQTVWDDVEPSSSLLKVYINKLRKKVDISPFSPLIHTLPGVGIVLKAKDENEQ